MKTEIIPTWSEADTRRINAIEEKLHLALRLSQRLEKKISVEYLDSEKQDFKTDAIICMIARIEDALDEICDYRVSCMVPK